MYTTWYDNFLSIVFWFVLNIKIHYNNCLLFKQHSLYYLGFSMPLQAGFVWKWFENLHRFDALHSKSPDMPWRIYSCFSDLLAVSFLHPRWSFKWIKREANSAPHCFAVWSLKNCLWGFLLLQIGSSMFSWFMFSWPVWVAPCF